METNEQLIEKSWDIGCRSAWATSKRQRFLQLVQYRISLKLIEAREPFLTKEAQRTANWVKPLLRELITELFESLSKRDQSRFEKGEDDVYE